MVTINHASYRCMSETLSVTESVSHTPLLGHRPVAVERKRRREELEGVKALNYHGPGKKVWESKDDPGIERPADAVVRIDTTTICGTDLHILKGDVPEVTDGRILGHEGGGTITQVGSGGHTPPA